MRVEERINLIINDSSLGSIDKITKIFFALFKQLDQNRRLLSVVLEYLLYISKSDVDPEKRVRRRTVKLRHIISTMLIEGLKTGELKKVNVKTTTDYLYCFIESAIFQLVILKRKNLSELTDAFAFALKQLANPDYIPEN